MTTFRVVLTRRWLLWTFTVSVMDSDGGFHQFASGVGLGKKHMKESSLWYARMWMRTAGLGTEHFKTVYLTQRGGAIR